MKRRAFLTLAAAVLPVAFGVTRFIRRRPASGAETTGASGSTTAAGSSPAAATQAETGVPGAAAGGDEAWQVRYGAGLPRFADPARLASPVASALAVAERQITANCADLSFANGAIHSVRALGRRELLGGEDPYRAILSHYLQANYVKGQVVLEVPRQLEGHHHAMLKTLVERQCEPDLEFEVAGRRHIFADYARSARLLYESNATAANIDEHSWSIIAFVRLMPPSKGRWRNLYGRVVDLERMIDLTSTTLHDETALIRQVDLGAGELPRDCPVLGRNCGGLHMLYALACALASGYSTPQRRSAFGVHMQTLLRRFTYDLKLVEEVYALNQQRVSEELAWLRALSGKLKFLGHSMEIVGLTQQYALYDFAASERAVTEQGCTQLYETLQGIASTDLSRFRSNKGLYESVVTDICHAYNGLLMFRA